MLDIILMSLIQICIYSRKTSTICNRLKYSQPFINLWYVIKFSITHIWILFCQSHNALRKPAVPIQNSLKILAHASTQLTPVHMQGQPTSPLPNENVYVSVPLMGYKTPQLSSSASHGTTGMTKFISLSRVLLLMTK